MATINLSSDETSAGHPQRHSAVYHAYVVGREIDLATAVTTKGSALAQGDVIEALDIPAGTMLLAGGAYKVSAMTGTSTDLTFDMGVTGGDVDNLVDGWDFDAAAVGDFGSTVGVQEPVFFKTADTLDILFATQTGTVTGGKIWVFAVLANVLPIKNPGIAALKS